MVRIVFAFRNVAGTADAVAPFCYVTVVIMPALRAEKLAVFFTIFHRTASLKFVRIYALEHDTVLEVQSAVFIRQEVIRYNADSASVRYGNLYNASVKVDADDIEGDERFAVVQFKFREIIRSELGEIGNFSFHRVYLRILFCRFRQGRRGAGTVAQGLIYLRYAEVNGKEGESVRYVACKCT